MPRELLVKKIDGKPGQVYYPLYIRDTPIPKPGPNQVLVRLKAAALNHRDLFIRQHLYPGIGFDHALLADGVGVVTEVGSGAPQDLKGRNVLVMPFRNWEDDEQGPGSDFHVAGGTAASDSGTGRDYMVIDASDVVPAPPHLSAVEAAALPLAGLTGWRAFVTKSGAAQKGKNVLITGIGGGVALQVLQFAVAMGVNAYVTSGSEEKLQKAKELGAKGGVNYKTQGWEKELKKQLPKDRPYLDAIVDGAGGDVVSKGVKLLRTGGVIAQYGMTVGPKMDWTMNAVLANLELKGSTMGSKKEFNEMVKFVAEHKIRPVISTTGSLDDMNSVEELFTIMKEGRNFGKLVIKIDDGAASPSKL
ncbi:hypothetical protein A1Q1_02788 [Trichosporon asahii var. asahii CBS 2479]|uniref:Enoyl reductase (ER) domain-containing protein n=1 Tax=Trichosporon asahii var. asahii (strain ATCC 90039 / CBS 2479 / JCM 2466 / KCTC 7840 / NBRC 103889/ NCYC 2677 / UAMH 7654) TaxID=1186058 RepID=J6EZC5_TRIAS|nr:hypothetical protein A1Q1_02788 [Trichosporon asahii var. asahii CBS 2479]EJT48222.1 hypothetical protein A1Q1_02788 [Trichosporon asahii var. asahii CBS 2479]